MNKVNDIYYKDFYIPWAISFDIAKQLDIVKEIEESGWFYPIRVTSKNANTIEYYKAKFKEDTHSPIWANSTGEHMSLKEVVAYFCKNKKYKNALTYNEDDFLKAIKSIEQYIEDSTDEELTCKELDTFCCNIYKHYCNDPIPSYLECQKAFHSELKEIQNMALEAAKDSGTRVVETSK